MKLVLSDRKNVDSRGSGECDRQKVYVGVTAEQILVTAVCVCVRGACVVCVWCACLCVCVCARARVCLVCACMRVWCVCVFSVDVFV